MCDVLLDLCDHVDPYGSTLKAMFVVLVNDKIIRTKFAQLT